MRCLAATKLRLRAPAVKSLVAGVAHNISLAQSVACSVMHHTLACLSPSEPLQTLWRVVEQSLVAGPRTWLGLAIHRLTPLFGWPTNLPNLQVLAADLALKQLGCLRFDLTALHSRGSLESKCPSG